MKSELVKDKSYIEFLSDLKKKIHLAQVKAALAVNAQMVFLYWEIGNSILRKQENEGWGAKVIERLSQDLRNAFPEIKGLSSRNLKYMRKFAETYPDVEFVQQLAAQIPWFHNCVLIDKVKSKKEREWYIQQTIQNGWSRNVLVHQIETNLYDRKGDSTHNFDATLPKPQSDLAKETLKDPYIFDFLTIGEEAHERDLENQLVMDITKFLLELGAGFSFVGRQYNLEVGGQDYFIDLLFYHLKLRCFVAIELKIGEFKPEYAGKINFYLSALDDLLKTEQDNPSIGIVLCKTKNRIIAEYALRDMSKPIGVSEYKLTEAIPEELRSSLPTIEELEAELMVNLKNNNK
ncbi:MAG: PDDEXK nuclease domain-containing protein [Thermodesulfobacteriota bacterium]|nr:PDDEXK nuclease domain-containing protein [Thermodesulfobacteriota bacterium]